jgi:hypothetical protein
MLDINIFNEVQIMGVFLCAISKRGTIKKLYVEKIASKEFEQNLNIQYDKMDTFISKSEKCFVVNFSRDNYINKCADQCYISEDQQNSITLLHGNMLPIKYDIEDLEFITAARMSVLLEKYDCEYIRDSYVGEYSVLKLFENGDCIAFNDRLSIEHIYYAEDEEMILISNRIRLVRCMLKEWEPDIENLNWIATMGSIVGCDTSVKGVRRIPQGAYIKVCEGNLKINRNDFFMYDNNIVDDFDSFFNANINVCINRLNACLKKHPTTVFPLSGGKDSRALFALLLKSNYSDKISIFTNGFENHPDVVVAKEITEHYGIKHIINVPKPKNEINGNQILRKLMGSVFQTDAMIGLWDASGYTAPQNQMLFVGHANEVYRSINGGRVLVNNLEDVINFYDSIKLFNAAKFLKKEHEELYKGKLRARAYWLIDNGVPLEDCVDLYFVQERLPNWTGYKMRHDGYSSNLINILNNDNLLKLSFQMNYKEREYERTHFEIIRRCDTWLTELHFGAQKWNEGLKKYAGNINISNEGVPIPSGIPTFGSWQYAINDSSDLKIQIWDILSSFDNCSLWDYYDKKHIERSILLKKFNYRELISLYGFLNVFFFVNNLEIPMKLKLPQADNGIDFKIPIKAEGSKTIYLYDGYDSKKKINSYEEYMENGINKLKTMNLSERAVALIG